MTIIESLLNLQDVDGRIRELEKEEKDLAPRKAKEAARLSGVYKDLEAAQAQLKYAKDSFDKYEQDAKALKDKIQQLKQAQPGLKSNKEYQQYSMQIDLLRHDLETTENSQVAEMDKFPSLERNIQIAQEKYDKEAGEVKGFCDEIDERLRDVAQALAEARGERVDCVKQVDSNSSLEYERIRTKRWPVVVQLTEEGVCDGCHLVQPPSIAQLVGANKKNGDNGKPQRIVKCTMCGRILYRD